MRHEECHQSLLSLSSLVVMFHKIIERKSQSTWTHSMWSNMLSLAEVYRMNIWFVHKKPYLSQVAPSEIQYPKPIKPGSISGNSSIPNTNNSSTAPGSSVFTFIGKDSHQLQQQGLTTHSILPTSQSAVRDTGTLSRPSSTGSGFQPTGEVFQVIAFFILFFFFPTRQYLICCMYS